MSTRVIGVGIIILALIVIIGYYISSSTGSAGSTPATKEFTLTVVGKALVAGPSTLTLQQGDSVVIRITSDEEEELHVHGYDRSVDLEPNVEATLTFVADASGRFPYELEKSKTELGSLEVLP